MPVTGVFHTQTSKFGAGIRATQTLLWFLAVEWSYMKKDVFCSQQTPSPGAAVLPKEVSKKQSSKEILGSPYTNCTILRRQFLYAV